MNTKLEGYDTPVTVGFIRRCLSSFDDDKEVQFTTFCFPQNNVPHIIKHCFIGGGVGTNSVDFDLCEPAGEMTNP